MTPALEKLSTPHGTLGTLGQRNRDATGMELSTPHGTLGTAYKRYSVSVEESFQLHTVH